jgi:hypothetical protein
MTTHGHSKPATPTYRSWRAMIDRCDRGAYLLRGIVVCDRWRHFENFLADMGERPDGCTLHRIEGGTTPYEQSNCEWAPQHAHPKPRPR